MNLGDIQVDNFKIGDLQVDRVYSGSTIVWELDGHVAPSPITDFVADEDVSPDYIEMRFTPSTGSPTPQHDLYLDGVNIQSDISSGYQYSGGECGNFYVVAWNEDSSGNVYEEVSNSEEGCITEPFYEVIIDYDTAEGDTQYLTDNGSGSWTFNAPAGHDSFNVCVIGGGGSGIAIDLCDATTYGGSAGDLISTTLTRQTAHSITIGLGATSYGSNGNDSTLDSIVSVGGTGGDYSGNGDTKTVCGFTVSDGTRDTNAYGGEAGLSNGANGVTCTSSGARPLYGSGGSGHSLSAQPVEVPDSCKGGNGRVIIRSLDWVPSWRISLSVGFSDSGGFPIYGYSDDITVIGGVSPEYNHLEEHISYLWLEVPSDTYHTFQFGIFSKRITNVRFKINEIEFPLEEDEITAGNYVYKSNNVPQEVMDYIIANVDNTIEVMYYYD